MKNHTQLIGFIGKDAELRRFTNGKVLANVSMATNESYRNKNGEKVQNTQWHRLVGWGKMAELMEQFFKKGKEIAITGQLNYQSYEDKQGQTRYVSQIVINQFTLLSRANK
ncbi:MAG: single-stranded DNA-binding protein [Bacteroidota bacterium]